MDVPSLSKAVPHRGNFISRAIGHAGMSISGWRFEGTMPNEPKFVIIVVPHTSNWDFIVGVEALFSLGLRVSFLGKHTLFRWPLGVFMKWLGGVPVERSVSKDRVAETIAAFDAADRLILAVAPEGTRKPVRNWRTGFYHVAHGAHVPIVPVAFDYGRKVVRLFPPFWTTGDADADIRQIKNCYADVVARNPDNFLL